MFRRILALLMLGVAVTALTVRAEPVVAPAKPAPANTDADSKLLFEQQQKLLRDYKAITEDLLTLAHRLEKSSRLEDQDKAKLIRKAIELGDKEGVDNKFQTLLRTLAGKNGALTINEVGTAKGQNEDLVKALKAIYDILMSDDEMARIKEEKDRLEKLLVELKGIIRATKVERALTESGKGDPKKRSEGQGDVAKKTENLSDKLNGGKEPPKTDDKGKDGKGKDGDGKAKDGKGKDGEPKDGKGGKGKDGEPKDGKGGKGKDGEPKDGKGGKGKDGEPKDGKGGKGKDGEGKDGMGKDGPPSPPSPPSPQGPKAPGADQVKKAVPDQQEAKKKIEEEKRPEAIQKQTDAIEKLLIAQAELEKRLKQLREEELERLLANLEARVAKMLQMQIEVQSSTIMIDKIILKSADPKKPEKPEIQKAQQQADKEGEIIVEANKAIDILKQEGSSVAFPRVFEETVIDMVRVKERLNAANVGKDTQADEQQIIDALKEMLEALKKAQQELKQPPPPGMGGGGQPPDQKLLDEIAELKMIRNLQVRVNERTKRKGDELKGEEQADDVQIKNELQDTARRQIKIEEMARDIATGKNK